MWKLVILQHDRGSKVLEQFFSKVWQDELQTVRIRPDKCLGSNIEGKRILEDTAEIRKAFEPFHHIEGKLLTIYGHGSYHHYTYGLCSAVARKRAPAYLYIHIDHHTDAGQKKVWRKNKRPAVHCANFVRPIRRLGGRNQLFLGTDSRCGHPVKYISQNRLKRADWGRVLRAALREKPIHEAYVSIDLDILTRSDVSTSYGSGRIGLKKLLQILEIIKQEKDLISADVLGLNSARSTLERSNCYYGPYYYEVNMLTYALIVYKIMGKNSRELMNMWNQYQAMNEQCREARSRNGVPITPVRAFKDSLFSLKI